jgi:glycosyltransferase involved in cell wall biosynthesis
MNNPFFSIIIPTYNRANTIQGSITSVLNQTFGAFELIVVDDGSTDNTKEVVSNFRDNRLKYVRQANAGVSQARNTGASQAAGEYLLFLDSDDSFTPRYLEKLHAEFLKGRYIIGFGFARTVDANGKEISFLKPQKSKELFGQRLAGSFAITKSFFKASSGYDPQLSYSENTEFFLRLKLGSQWDEDSICLVPDEGVIVTSRDSRMRFLGYSGSKYKSIGYFLEKHKTYFSQEVEVFLLFKAIYAIGAFQSGDVREAKRAIMHVICRRPFRLKPYLHYLMFSFPFLARLHWGPRERT